MIYQVKFGVRILCVKKNYIRTVYIQDQTARSVQSDLDLHSPEKKKK